MSAPDRSSTGQAQCSICRRFLDSLPVSGSVKLRRDNRLLTNISLYLCVECGTDVAARLTYFIRCKKRVNAR